MKIFYNTKFYNENILTELKMMSDHGDAIHCGLSSLIAPDKTTKEYTFKELIINEKPSSNNDEETKQKVVDELIKTDEGYSVEISFIDRADIGELVDSWINDTIDLNKPVNKIIWVEELTFKTEF